VRLAYGINRGLAGPRMDILTRSAIPAGVTGWAAAGELDLDLITRLSDQG
jgi:hypothetical protein